MGNLVVLEAMDDSLSPTTRDFIDTQQHSGARKQTLMAMQR